MNTRTWNSWRFFMRGLAIGAAILIASCTESKQQHDTSTATQTAIPVIDTSHMQPRVANRIREARQDVAREPDSARAWGRLGMVLHVHREYAQATVCYGEARRLATDEFRWVYFLARVLDLEGHDSSEVIALYEQAVDLNPSYAQAHARLGDALVRDGQFEKASSVLERAIGYDPTLSKAHRNLGQVYLLLGEVDRALIHLETASALQPEDGAVWATLAQGHARNGDEQRATEAATKATSLQPIHAMDDPAMQAVSDEGISSTICLRRAREYIKRGNFENALQQLLIVAEVDSQNVSLHHQIASVAWRARRPKVAITYFERTIALDPKNIAPYSSLAGLLLQEARPAEAVLHLRRAVSEIPENSMLHALLGSALAQSGQIAQANEEFVHAMQFGELSPRDYNNWGNALQTSGALEDAVDKYQAALRLDRDYANTHYNLATTLERLGRESAAIEHYQAAIKLDPNHRAKASLDRLLSDTP